MFFYTVSISDQEENKLSHINVFKDELGWIGFIICSKSMAEAAAYVESYGIMTVRFDWELRERAFYFMNKYNMDIIFI